MQETQKKLIELCKESLEDHKPVYFDLTIRHHVGCTTEQIK